jgi:hypothetical protein
MFEGWRKSEGRPRSTSPLTTDYWLLTTSPLLSLAAVPAHPVLDVVVDDEVQLLIREPVVCRQDRSILNLLRSRRWIVSRREHGIREPFLKRFVVAELFEKLGVVFHQTDDDAR